MSRTRRTWGEGLQGPIPYAFTTAPKVSLLAMAGLKREERSTVPEPRRDGPSTPSAKPRTKAFASRRTPAKRAEEAAAHQAALRRQFLDQESERRKNADR